MKGDIYSAVVISSGMRCRSDEEAVMEKTGFREYPVRIVVYGKGRVPASRPAG
jgi:hypothetical protein